jgi:membrane protein YdbS with pleckstrin-like domain
MLDFLKRIFCSLLRLPDKPKPPVGTAGTLKIFRAAPGFLKYRYLRFFGLGLINNIFVVIFIAIEVADAFSGPPNRAAVITLFVLLGLYLVTLFLTCIIGVFAILLDYDFRWYQVTDRSLRIREGVIRVREMTVTFDNVQEVAVEQGPVQRIFGIADVIVRTAGGKNPLQQAKNKNQPQATDFHKAVFRGVGNAQEIRDLIQNRVRSLQTMGIGQLLRVADTPRKQHKGLLTAPAYRQHLLALREEAANLCAVAESIKI